MKRWLIVGVLFTGFLMVVNPAMAQTKSLTQATATNTTTKLSAKSEKERDIKMLLGLSGSGTLGVQVMTQLSQAYSKLMPNVPQEFWDEFLEEADADSLVMLIIPIYAKHFTHEEIKELIVFYQSPIGKKLVAAQPQILQESQAVGEKWGQEIGARIVKRLQEKGYQ